MRLRRVKPDGPGYTRRRRGRGFSYYGENGAHITDSATAERIQALAVPPAWHDVWICALPEGHIQAVGTDDAGRRQYRYHDEWRRRRDADKHDRVLRLARRLPTVRTQIREQLEGRGLSCDRVLAAALRMLDIGAFRIGSDPRVLEHYIEGRTILPAVRRAGASAFVDEKARARLERELLRLLHLRQRSCNAVAQPRAPG
jgi:DNA topoisomerase I